jgi:hypothetical protein
MTYTLVDGRVVRTDGYIAMTHRTTNPATVRVGDVSYYFTPRNNVSLEWVSPEHVNKLLSERARICCGQNSQKFFLASLINTNLHVTGRREG